jgi:hypothetical protein
VRTIRHDAKSFPIHLSDLPNKMFYWNDSNFEGLAEIGAKLATEPDYEKFAEYCLNKEKGLRKQANQAASEFVRRLRSLALPSRQNIAVRLARLQVDFPHVHQLLPHPIMSEVVQSLSDLCRDEPLNVTCRVLLGMLTNDLEHFRSAMLLDPNEQTSIRRLAQSHLDHIEFQTHHLSESRFIGTIEEAKYAIAQAQSLLQRISNPETRGALTKELSGISRLIDEWTTYLEDEPSQPFPEWARARGNSFNFPSIVYYER